MTLSGVRPQAVCAAARRHDAGGPEGALRAVFLDHRGAILLTVGFDEGTDHVDELFLRHLVATVDDLAVPAVVFAVMRRSARPTRIDKLLWRELGRRLASGPTRLLDVLVIGPTEQWSVGQSLALTSPAARWPDRTAPSM
jgi:hypothetical protein